MRPSNDKVDMEDFVFHFSTHKGYAVPSYPNSNSSSFKHSNEKKNCGTAKKGIRQFDRLGNSSGKPFFFEGNSLFSSGESNSTLQASPRRPFFCLQQLLARIFILNPCEFVMECYEPWEKDRASKDNSF